MLDHLINRLKSTPSLDGVVLAATTHQTNDVLQEFQENIIGHYEEGGEDDVMSRFVGAAKSFNADIIVMIVGDYPVIDPAITE